MYSIDVLVVSAYVCFFVISHLLTLGKDIGVNGGGYHSYSFGF